METSDNQHKMKVEASAGLENMQANQRVREL